MGLITVSPLRSRRAAAPAAATDQRPPIPLSVVVLIGVLITWALVLDVAVLHVSPLRQIGASRPGLFPLAILAFGVAEAIVIHVELGRNAHTISLAELPLTVALFFLPAGSLPVARLLGGGFVLLAIRRQRPVKATFNGSVWLLDVAAATAVFQALHGNVGDGAGRIFAPALAAALTAAAVDSVAVNVVIAVTSGEMHVGPALRFLANCLIGAFVSAMFGILCIGALAASAWSLVAIAVVAGVVLVGFRAFGVLHRRHTNVKVLYDFTDSLSRSPHGDSVVHTVLSRVVELLRVERAELWLDWGDGNVQVTVFNGPDRVMRRDIAAAHAPELIRQVMAGDGPVTVRGGEQRRVAAHFLTEHGVRDAVLVSIDAQQGLHGALVVANRLGDVSSFSSDDARLLQTLAAHTGTALVNSRLVQRLDHDSTHDSLTGLANRAYFQHQLDQRLHAWSTISVLLMDLDRFKEVNDTLGHHHGDLLLQQIAARLRSQLREGDLLARLGGDEFAIVITGATLTTALATAERVRTSLAAPMQLQGVDIEVNASIGIAYTDGGPGIERHEPLSAATMLQRADVAMYAAKHDGTGVHVYQSDLDEHSPRRLALASGLRAAIEGGQLSLRYQPQIRLTDDAVVGVEALVRWEHPSYGEVPPDEFIGLAEQTGQIRELTRYVLDEALTQAARWARAGRPLAMSINIAVRNLMESDLPEAIATLLQRHDFPSRLLTLEITESQLMADASRTRRVLAQLAALGLRLSVDDFGTGYSSLAYLKQLPVTEIKIDRGFVRDLADDPNDAAIVEAIVQLARTLHVRVVAEGVEDVRADLMLRELACDAIQGFLIAPPLTAGELDCWLDERESGQRHRGLRALPQPRTSAAVVGR